MATHPTNLPRPPAFRPRRRRPMLAALVATATLTALAGTGGCEERTVSVNETPITVLSEKIGGGPKPRRGDIACVAYVLRFPDGRILMQDDETCLTVGAENAIAALLETLDGMRTGGRREVVVPPHKHWGREGYGPVPPGTTLHLELSLLAVHPPTWSPRDED